MVAGQQNLEGRSLLGFGAPGGVRSSGGTQSVRGQGDRADAGVAAGETPARPDYNIVSSGRDSEDDESTGKRSDVATALGAGLMLVVFLVVVGLLFS